MSNNPMIHPQALVESEHIGTGTRVWAFSHIMPGVAIGTNCNIGEHCFVEAGCVIGNNVTVKNGNQIWAGVVLSDNVFVGPQVVFTNDLYPRARRLHCAAERYDNNDWLKPTTVEEGASIGAGAVILAGRRLKKFCLIGAGAVVTHDVPAHAMVVGNPAKVVAWVCYCGERLSFIGEEATCARCSQIFVRAAEGGVIARSRERLLA